MLGTNGGGFFNANSAHPFENPDAADRTCVQMLSIFAIGAGADLHLRPDGRRQAPGLGDPRRDGLLFLAGVARHLLGRGARATRCFTPLGVDSAAGNMEGKEVRFGIAAQRPVRGRHHRRLVRRGQRHARQLHAARRA